MKAIPHNSQNKQMAIKDEETIKRRAILCEKIEHKKSSIRAKVEHVFLVVKNYSNIEKRDTES